MGKPRMIILIRHAQSEGNKNRDIHQFIPDHRVKLTQHGWTQAEEAGRQLRSMLKPDDTLQFYTSPYRRTRETTEGILRTLTSDDPTPSPFPRNKITVFEEPRIREQDFGNFQPCSAEMERMWQERADYGHFFYRIPDGESAADAYDRVSGFNESLWRSFGDDNFPSVCVLVTHGLMSRVFLMKWYHWSVEYFEDLRNVNHCEFIIMKRSENNGRYILQNELRTWSELKRRAAKEKEEQPKSATAATPSRNTSLSNLNQAGSTSSPTVPIRRWGGCVNGCNHDKINYPRRPMRKNTMEYLGQGSQQTASPATQHMEPLESEQEDHPVAAQEADHAPIINEPSPAKLLRKQTAKGTAIPAMPPTPASPNDASNDASSSEEGDNAHLASRSNNHAQPRTTAILRHLQPMQAGEGFSDDSDYFPGMQHLHHSTGQRKFLRASSTQRKQSKDRKIQRKQTEQGWLEESGMGKDVKTDRLGDGDATSDDAAFAKKKDEEPPILREALKGNMIVEHSEEEREAAAATNGTQPDSADKKVTEKDIDKMQDAERKGLDEVY